MWKLSVLIPNIFVELIRFERTTLWMQTRYSNQTELQPHDNVENTEFESVCFSHCKCDDQP